MPSLHACRPMLEEIERTPTAALSRPAAENWSSSSFCVGLEYEDLKPLHGIDDVDTEVPRAMYWNTER